MATGVEKYQSSVPTGTIINFMGNNAPIGYLKCDGAEYNIADYQALADFFNTEFGQSNYFGGDGTTTFKVPDLKGEFLRGTGTNGHTNTNTNTREGDGASVGTHQGGTTSPWLWTASNLIGAFHNPNDVGSPNNVDRSMGTATTNGNVSMSGGQSQTGGIMYTSRPTNTSVLYCIKY